MIKSLSAGLLAALLAAPLPLFALETDPALVDEQSVEEQLGQSEQEQYIQWATQTWEAMNPQTGEIKLPNGVATLQVPETFYYLSPQDSKVVLEDIWGNPPSDLGLGMLFPADVTPFDESAWAVTIDYVEDGYIDDENAAGIDYDDMLKDMKKEVRDESGDRVAQGYDSIELVGWASQPYYDTAEKKLHWAKEIKFGGADDNTLNYNIRVLGRRGYLTLNFIADMDQLSEVNANVPAVLEIAEFDQGHRYADFDPDVDHVAAYGIGALVAGKVLAKTGMLAAVLLAFKKFWVLALVGLGALGRKLFGGKKAD